MLIDSELIAWSTATLVATQRYTLSAYIRRAQAGSTVAAHGAGALFAVMGPANQAGGAGGFIRFPYSAAQAGKTIYLKFCSFNKFGLEPQDISEVTPYTFVLP